jgi:hypothetical protein
MGRGGKRLENDMKNGLFVATAVAALSLGLAPLAAQNEMQNPQDQQIQTEPQALEAQGALDTNISEASDGELIELSGTARDVEDGGFTLEHAEGSIDVALDEENGVTTANVAEGERVRVSGLVSDGWLTAKSIQAHSVQPEADSMENPAGPGTMNAPTGDMDGGMGGDSPMDPIDSY